MSYADKILTADPSLKRELRDYEESISSLALSQKLYDGQQFNEQFSEANLLKTLLLFLASEDEVRHEVRRIISWKHAREKARLLIEQLASYDEAVVIASIDMLGALRQPMAIGSLGVIFDMRNVELAKHVITSLSQIDHPMGARIISRALAAENREIVILAVDELADKVEDMPWKTFRNLLGHEDREIREKAFFAITMRKNSRSARTLLKALEREKDAMTRRSMVQHVGSVPSARLLSPLLETCVRDPSQKMRLTASRTVDRLQGILDPKFLFRLRHTRDMDIKVEVAFRLGKFGSDREKIKDYLRKTLMRGEDMRMKQACIVALGYIADHDDVGLISRYLKEDPVTTYNATMALTRIWRMEDGEKLVKALMESESATQKQILLKYAARRRGMTLPPDRILHVVRKVLEAEDNINVRYLAFALLEYAPSVETAQFIMSAYAETENQFEQDALKDSIDGISALHGDDILELISRCDQDTCCIAVPLLPANLEARLYARLAGIIFAKYRTSDDTAGKEKLCGSVFKLLNSSPVALREFVLALPDVEWKRFFLRMISKHASREGLEYIRDVLIDFLYEPDAGIRKLAIRLILSLRDPEVIPKLVSVSESEATTEIRNIARDAARTLVEEWIP